MRPLFPRSSPAHSLHPPTHPQTTGATETSTLVTLTQWWSLSRPFSSSSFATSVCQPLQHANLQDAVGQSRLSKNIKHQQSFCVFALVRKASPKRCAHTKDDAMERVRANVKTVGREQKSNRTAVVATELVTPFRSLFPSQPISNEIFNRHTACAAPTTSSIGC
jgi:hypothetical protein